MIKLTAMPMITVILLKLAMLHQFVMPLASPAERLPANIDNIPWQRMDQLHVVVSPGLQAGPDTLTWAVAPVVYPLSDIHYANWNQRVLHENL